jgi:hypothetical protein
LFELDVPEGKREAEVIGCGDAIVPPGGADVGADQVELMVVLWLEGGEDVAGVVVEDGFVFGGDDELVGVDAVFECVERGAELALAGFGAGAFECVAAVGCDLFLGGHG